MRTALRLAASTTRDRALFIASVAIALAGCAQLRAGALASQEEDCLRRVPSGLDMVQCSARTSETDRQYDARRERLSNGQSEKAPARAAEPMGCFKRAGSGETACPN